MAMGDPVLQSKNSGGKFNIEAYGASTSASASANVTAIQNAVNAAEVTGGEVYIPPGEFTTNAQVVVNGYGVSIRGNGPYSSRLYSTGGSNIINFGNSGLFGGVANLSFRSSSSRTAIYLTDGNYPSLHGGGGRSVFTNLGFGSGITRGIRIGIVCNHGTIHNLQAWETDMTYIVHVDTSAASEANDNPTVWVMSDISGYSSIAGVYYSGNAFGDHVVTNVNMLGTAAGACGVRLVGGAYYHSRICVSNLHLDGIGTASFKASGCDNFTVMGITRGGAIANYVDLTSCTTYFYVSAGGYGSG